MQFLMDRRRYAQPRCPMPPTKLYIYLFRLHTKAAGGLCTCQIFDFAENRNDATAVPNIPCWYAKPIMRLTLYRVDLRVCDDRDPCTVVDCLRRCIVLIGNQPHRYPHLQSPVQGRLFRLVRRQNNSFSPRRLSPFVCRDVGGTRAALRQRSDQGFSREVTGSKGLPTLPAMPPSQISVYPPRQMQSPERAPPRGTAPEEKPESFFSFSFLPSVFPSADSFHRRRAHQRYAIKNE